MAAVAELVDDTRDLVAAGRRFILGDGAPFDPERGLSLLRRARALGDGEAAALEATLAAAGAWRRQSWDDALDLLVEAAKRGHGEAQGQLRLLAGADPDVPDWARLRGGLALDDWFSAPARQPICQAPRIRAAQAFASAPVCRWMMERARGRLQPAKMVDGYGGAPRFTSRRTNSDFIIDILKADVVLCLLRHKISLFVGSPTVCFEPPQVLHYATGQELKPHYDFLQNQEARTTYTGDRVLTFLLYLNDDYRGGETDFPKAGFRHKGAEGDCIVFANVDVTGRPDPLTLHAGLPPEMGEKWLFSQWIHNQPFSTQSTARS